MRATADEAAADRAVADGAVADEAVADEAERRRAFVVTHTRLRLPPHVPEVALHLADEVSPLWEMTEQELDRHGLEPPFWAFAWAGGQALARYLLDRPQVVAGARVLDLASGSGLCAIAAMLAGATDAVAVDVDPFALAAIGLNAAANGVTVRVDGTDLLDGGPPAADIVLAGDVCYDHGMARRVLPWLRAARAAGVRVLIGDPGRRYLPADGLVALARYEVPTTPELEEREFTEAAVYALG